MSALATLKTIAPYHVLLYSSLFGSTAYQTFYAGIVAYRVLPMKYFGLLQNKLLGNFFYFQTAASLMLLVTVPFRMQVGSALSLSLSLFTSILNSAVLLPINRRIKEKRQIACAKEGKDFRDPTASDYIKELNRDFAKAHTLSLGADLVGFLALLCYGVNLVAQLQRC